MVLMYIQHGNTSFGSNQVIKERLEPKGERSVGRDSFLNSSSFDV